MKLRQQLLLLGTVGILMACLVGAIGLFNAGRLAQAIDNSAQLSESQADLKKHTQDFNKLLANIQGMDAFPELNSTLTNPVAAQAALP